MATATLNPERTCPDCSYRTSSPRTSLCPVCNVPLLTQARTWAPVRRPLRVQLPPPGGGRAPDGFEVTVFDLTIFGARLALRDPLRTGRCSTLTIHRPDFPEALTLPVRVLWTSVRRTDPGHELGAVCHSGVEFRNLPAAVDRALASFLGGPGGTCGGPLQGTLTPLPE